MNLATICRLCFKAGGNLLEMSPFAVDICESCLGLQLRSVQGSKMCHRCSNFLERICNFKLMCLESENQLVDVLYQQQSALSLNSSFDACSRSVEVEKEEQISDLKAKVLPSVEATKIVVVNPNERDELREKKRASRVRNYYKTRDQLGQCDICGKQLKFLCLKSHRERHTRTEMYECDFCQKKLLNKPQLKRHIENLHLKIRRAFCAHCPPDHEGFVDILTRNAHIKVHHGTKFVCSICGSEKKTKQALKSHIETTHTNTSKFKCQYCDCTFPSERGINYHILSSHKASEKVTNFGELTTTCICGVACYSRKSFRIHVDGDHKDSEGRWKCPEPCSRLYARRVKLVDHFRSYHKIPFQGKVFSKKRQSHVNFEIQ